MIAAVACVILAVAILATVLAGQTRPPRSLTDEQHAALLERHRGSLTALRRELDRERDAHSLAAARAYEAMLTRRLLEPVAPPAPDPGNPGAQLRLARDVYGAVTEPRGLLLLVQNPPDGLYAPLALPVPPGSDDPVTAAAWTYDVPRDTYLQLARRT